MTATRKQQFNAALDLAGLTMTAWCELNDVTPTHVNYVLKGDRNGSAELNAAIDRLIDRHLAA